MTIPDNTPILVGVGAIQQKTKDLSLSKEPIDLMHDAVKAALKDCEASEIAPDIQQITVPRGMWSYSNPAKLIADEIGAVNALCEFAEFGILQQSNLGQACQRIAAGELDCAMVVGGEAKFRQLQGQIQGVEVSELEQLNSEPDRVLQPDAELWSEHESATGLGMAVGYYALLESAICAAEGLSMDKHRDNIAATYARFSEIGADNPDGWIDQALHATEIRNASDKNKMLAFPYAKYHNSQWNVNQACALLFCSAKKAKAMGIPESKWIFPLASTESNQMLNVSQRPDLANSVAAKLAGESALKHANLAMNEINFIELYSCFPAAVNLFVRALNIPKDRDLTVGGAMPFAGGPVNNFFLQATVKMAQYLRAKPNSYGLTSCVSGMFTKQGFGVWSSAPYSQAFVFDDVSAEAIAGEPPLPLVAPVAGNINVVATTVLYQGTEAERAIAIGEYSNGDRTIAYSQEKTVIDWALKCNQVGSNAAINDEGHLAINS